MNHKIRIAAMVSGIVLVSTGGAAAAKDFKADPGQPFCNTEQDLAAYLVSALTNDRSLKFDCEFLKAGELLTVVEVTSEGTAAKTFRARVKGHPGIGWSMQVRK